MSYKAKIFSRNVFKNMSNKQKSWSTHKISHYIEASLHAYLNIQVDPTTGPFHKNNGSEISIALQESFLFSTVENVRKSISNHWKKYFRRFKWPLRTTIKNYVETFFLHLMWPSKNVIYFNQQLLNVEILLKTVEIYIFFVEIYIFFDK